MKPVYVISRPRVKLRQSPAFARRFTCHAASEGGGGRQYETEFFRKLFGTPPAPKADTADGEHAVVTVMCGKVIVDIARTR